MRRINVVVFHDEIPVTIIKSKFVAGEKVRWKQFIFIVLHHAKIQILKQRVKGKGP
jgi:hypothetical protein